MRNQNNDIEFEKSKYNARGMFEKQFYEDNGFLPAEVEGISLENQKPFKDYYSAVNGVVSDDTVVLELGAGTGRHSVMLSKIKSNFYALDISQDSLDVLKIRLGGVKTLCSEMTSIPMGDKSVDVVLSCGSLSYAKLDEVLLEIDRVIKPGGFIVILDSLNHNPLYKLNRWVHLKRGLRSKSTLINMPTMQAIDLLRISFPQEVFRSFGASLPVYYILKRLVGSRFALLIFEEIEKWFTTSKYGFKFLFVGQRPLS